MTTGVLEILNVQGGEVKIVFDPADPKETIRAKGIVTDMLRRGYALVVEIERDGETAYERVQKFDAATGEYLIAAAATEPAAEPAKKRGQYRRRLPMESANATAVAPSAGG
jgi:hypothetical protein